jgi:TRAP-type C4-dicarboxylate transport system permease small subunit
MLIQVFMRSIFGFSFSWSVEMSQYLNVWLTFIGIAYLRKTDSHIKIEMLSDVLDRKLSDTGRVALYIGKKLLNIFFMVLLIYLGYQLAKRSWNFRSPALQLRQTWLYMSVPIGALGYLFRELQDIYRVYKTHLEGRR